MRRVRRLIGDPHIDEYPDTDIESNIRLAILEYSKKVPRVEMIEMEVQAGESVKDLPADVLNLLAHSYHSVPEWFITQDPFSRMEVEVAAGLTAYTVNPSLQGYMMDAFLLDYQLDMLRSKSNSEVIQSGSQVQIIPTPDSSVKLFLLVTKTRILDQIPDRHELILVKKIAALCAVELANSRAKFASIKVGSESLNLRDPKYLLDQAKQWEEEFNSTLRSTTIGPL